jgi:hypothetical protein
MIVPIHCENISADRNPTFGFAQSDSLLCCLCSYSFAFPDLVSCDWEDEKGYGRTESASTVTSPDVVRDDSKFHRHQMKALLAD